MIDCHADTKTSSIRAMAKKKKASSKEPVWHLERDVENALLRNQLTVLHDQLAQRNVQLSQLTALHDQLAQCNLQLTLQQNQILSLQAQLFHRCLGRDADDQNLIAKLVAKLLESECCKAQSSVTAPCAAEEPVAAEGGPATTPALLHHAGPAQSQEDPQSTGGVSTNDEEREDDEWDLVSPVSEASASQDVETAWLRNQQQHEILSLRAQCTELIQSTDTLKLKLEACEQELRDERERTLQEQQLRLTAEAEVERLSNGGLRDDHVCNVWQNSAWNEEPARRRVSSCSTAACEDEVDEEMADEECAGQESTVSEDHHEEEGQHGDDLPDHHEEEGQHGDDLPDHHEEEGQHGDDLPDHHEEEGQHGDDLPDHHEEEGQHGDDLPDHHEEEGQHGDDLPDHHEEEGQHGDDLPALARDADANVSVGEQLITAAESARPALTIGMAVVMASVPELLNWRLLSRRTSNHEALIAHVAEMGSMRRPENIVAFMEKRAEIRNNPDTPLAAAFGGDAEQQKVYDCLRWCAALAHESESKAPSPEAPVADAANVLLWRCAEEGLPFVRADVAEATLGRLEEIFSLSSHSDERRWCIHRLVKSLQSLSEQQCQQLMDLLVRILRENPDARRQTVLWGLQRLWEADDDPRRCELRAVRILPTPSLSDYDRCLRQKMSTNTTHDWGIPAAELDAWLDCWPAINDIQCCSHRSFRQWCTVARGLAYTTDLSFEASAVQRELADAAGNVIRQYWRKPVEVESKLEYDRPVAEYPSHGIIGEEFGSLRQNAEWVWVLDPIDGTKSFITGKPLFGTLIALLRNGVPALGIIDQCVLGERWLGANGRTTLNGKAVRARGAARLEDAMMYATTPHMFGSGHEEQRFSALRSQVKRPLYGCDCYAYGLVAAGFGADLVVEADLGIYDYCALVPVVICAGGRMTDWSGQPLTLQSHELSRGRVVAAANDTLWKAAVSILSMEEKATTALSRFPLELEWVLCMSELVEVVGVDGIWLRSGAAWKTQELLSRFLLAVMAVGWLQRHQVLPSHALFGALELKDFVAQVLPGTLRAWCNPVSTQTQMDRTCTVMKLALTYFLSVLTESVGHEPDFYSQRETLNKYKQLGARRPNTPRPGLNLNTYLELLAGWLSFLNISEQWCQPCERDKNVLVNKELEHTSFNTR
ncbi:Bifunctional phosphatase IMPL2, chloroplastic [Symbiodinium microadriaticum]|uniref:Bifunctional phosphatase IMPL2, chloroplastic n=2 Tax=Symbiodinium TaxID=2949 RepID=A0A1Q9EHI9_SYMMI|nr:Bifunctional phosphatase IMPL2, chloroplastic [Symbiodinium microadriaticum]